MELLSFNVFLGARIAYARDFSTATKAKSLQLKFSCKAMLLQVNLRVNLRLPGEIGDQTPTTLPRFICFYKNSATAKMDPLDAWRTLGPAKNTDAGKAIKAWCRQMHEKYGDEEKDEEGRADQSFASPEEPKTG